MKKISKFYSSTILLEFIFTQASAAMFLYFAWAFFDSVERDWLSTNICLFFAMLGEIAFWCSWWGMRFSTGTYEVNAQGITTQNRGKRTHISWESCQEVGLAKVRVSQVKVLVYAYATTKPLTATEKSKFLASRKKDWEHTAFFECDEESVKELLSVLPEHLSASVRFDAVRMGWWECLRG
jgi:hypothetical protein